MCGIFGYLLRNSGSAAAKQHQFSFRQLWNSLHTLKGRGPENTNLLQVSQNLVLGFQRLRINDVSESGD